jgi:hypothetical protein
LSSSDNPFFGVNSLARAGAKVPRETKCRAKQWAPRRGASSKEAGQDWSAPVTDHPNLTRRETLIFGVAALTSMLAQGASAQEAAERHGISAFGDLKYPPDNSIMSTRMRRKAGRSRMSART